MEIQLFIINNNFCSHESMKFILQFERSSLLIFGDFQNFVAFDTVRYCAGRIGVVDLEIGHGSNWWSPAGITFAKTLPLLAIYMFVCIVC